MNMHNKIEFLPIKLLIYRYGLIRRFKTNELVQSMMNIAVITHGSSHEKSY